MTVSAQALLKRLRDFPLNKWIDGAGKCPHCYEGKVRVKVTFVDGDFGDVVWSCLSCGSGDHNVAGWEYGNHQVTLLGKTFTTLAVTSNVVLCLNCERLVVDVPLILFVEEGKKGQLNFCWDCAQELGLLNKMLRGRS